MICSFLLFLGPHRGLAIMERYHIFWLSCSGALVGLLPFDFYLQFYFLLGYEFTHYYLADTWNLVWAWFGYVRPCPDGEFGFLV